MSHSPLGLPKAPRLPAGKLQETILDVLFYAERPLKFETLYHRVQKRLSGVTQKSVYQTVCHMTLHKKSLARQGPKGAYEYFHPGRDYSVVTITPPDPKPYTAPEPKKAVAPKPEAPAAAPLATKTIPIMSASFQIGTTPIHMMLTVGLPEGEAHDTLLAFMGQLVEHTTKIIGTLHLVEQGMAKAAEERDAALELAEQATREAAELRAHSGQATDLLHQAESLFTAIRNINGQGNGNGNGDHADALHETVVVAAQ